MLMNTRTGAIDTDPPVQLTGRVSLGQQPHQDLVPHPATRQLGVSTPHRPPRPIPLRDITPRTPSPKPVDDAVDQWPVIAERPAALVLRARHQRLDQRPLSVRKITRVSHGANNHGPTPRNLRDTP